MVALLAGSAIVRLRWKLVVAAAIVWVVGVAALWQLNGLVVGRGFTRTEETAAAADGRRVADGVGAMQVSLGQLTRLQAVWDDPFALARAGDGAGFAEVYPPADMWQSYRVRYVIVVDPSGALIGGGSTDADAATFGELPSALADANALSYFAKAGTDAGCGLWRAGREGVLTYCTHAILPTDGSGDAAGYLTMLQPLDQTAIDQLAARLGLSLRPGDDAADAGLIAPGGSRVVAVDDATLEVHTNLAVNNDPGLGANLVASIGRPVHTQAVSTERNVLLISAALWAALLAVVLFVADRTVLARTRAISADLRQLDDAAVARIVGAVPATGSGDELDELTAAIGQSLQAMQERERRLQAERADAEALLAEADAARLAAIDERIEAQAVRAAAASDRRDVPGR